MGVIIAGAAIAAVGAVAGAVVSSNAAKKAAQTQADALKSVKGVDIPAVEQEAKNADVQKYKDQFDLLNQYDPVTGQLRSNTNDALNQYATNDTNANQANSILNTLFNENKGPDSTDLNFYNTLRTQAQGQLDQGGALSPEQQSEIVRAGLEGASTTGLNAGSAAARQSIGGLLASQVTAQQQARQQMAQNLFGFATQLKDNNNAQQQAVAQTSLAASQAQGNKLLGLANLADSRVPNVGLSGGDIANLAVGNQNQANQTALQQGAINASNAQARAQIAAGLIGGLTSAAGTAAGAYKAPATTAPATTSGKLF